MEMNRLPEGVEVQIVWPGDDRPWLASGTGRSNLSVTGEQTERYAALRELMALGVKVSVVPGGGDSPATGEGLRRAIVNAFASGYANGRESPQDADEAARECIDKAHRYARLAPTPDTEGEAVSRLASALVALGGFLAGAAAMLALVDRLFGGEGIRIELDEPWGDL